MNAEILPQEIIQAPERQEEHKQLLGLQARFLMADQTVLNPNTTCPPPTEGNITSFEEREYDPFENTSVYDRQTYWNAKVAERQTTIPFADMYAQWQAGIITTFTDTRNQETMQKLQRVFETIGVEGKGFSEEKAKRLYDRYFKTQPDNTNGKAPKGVKLFLQDVLAAYSINGTINYAEAKNDLRELEWLADIFGKPSSKIISQLIEAEISLKADEAYPRAIGKPRDNGKIPANDLDEEEIRLLKHIDRHKEKPPAILKQKEEIQALLKDPMVKRIIVSAGTGTGKTTQLPQMIEEIMQEGDKLVVTQPRRLPTEDLAERVASERDSVIGEIIGFRHGKRSKVLENTPVVFMVEGTLLRELSRDPLLLNYSFAMVDEWHERHKQTDILLALLLRAQKLREEALHKGQTKINGKKVKPLKILITSATLEKEKLQKHLEDSSTVEVSGKQHEINDLFEPPGSAEIPIDQMPAKAAQYALDMLKPGRNVLIFMPGERRIRQTYNTIVSNNSNVQVEKLYGAQEAEIQERAKAVEENSSRIIISTPIAETGLTIPRVDVISCGYINLLTVDPKTGLEILEEKPHSQKGVMQQRGRTGRESEGTFRFLGTKQEFENRFEHHPAEIIRSDLTPEMLLLYNMGINIDDLQLIEKPDQRAIERARRNLRILGAIDQNGIITNIGKEMADLPMDPHLARMLIEAKNKGCLQTALIIAGLFQDSKRTLFERPRDEDPTKFEAVKESFNQEGSYFLTALHLWQEFQKQPENEREKWAKENFLNYSMLSQAKETINRLSRRYANIPNPQSSNLEILEQCIVIGFKDKLLKRTADGRTYYKTHEPHVGNLRLDRDSAVNPKDNEYVISAINVPRKTREGIVYMQQVQRVKPEWLQGAA